MKTTLLMSTMLGTTLILVGCGGSGSSSSAAPAPLVQPNNPNSTPKATIGGNIITLKSADNSIAKANTESNTTTDINKVVIDGKTVEFIPVGITAEQLSLRSGNLTRVGGSSSLSYTRFGYTKEGRSGEESAALPYLFAQGVLTTNMPTTGTATYKGYAAHVEQGGHPSIRKSEFQVDYAQKTVNGTISTSLLQESPVHLAGTISGNRFSGTKDGITTNGAFYGPNAAELGGTYHNATGTVSGAYGAKK